MNPLEDGITHINIYSKGATELGRLLSNFAHSPFVYPDLGKFECLEGFWYWHLTGRKYEQFRALNGYESKKLGKTLRDDRIDNEGMSPEDKEIILEAIRCKLRQNRYILNKLAESELPFTHYYWSGDINKPKIQYLPQYSWLTKEFERIRKLMKKN